MSISIVAASRSRPTSESPEIPVPVKPRVMRSMTGVIGSQWAMRWARGGRASSGREKPDSSIETRMSGIVVSWADSTERVHVELQIASAVHVVVPPTTASARAHGWAAVLPSATAATTPTRDWNTINAHSGTAGASSTSRGVGSPATRRLSTSCSRRATRDVTSV